MMPIARIVVPVDLSAGSVGAAAYATSLAVEFGSELLFLHALQNGWPLDDQQREIRDHISAAAGAHRFLFREGSPASAILNTAEAEDASLILMSSRGKSARGRFLGGSITAQVLREARCPVWVGLGNLVPLPSKPIRTILCGLTLGPRASAVLRWSADVARTFKATLSVIHACKALEPHPGVPCDHEWRCWLKKMARDYLGAVQAGLGTDAEVWLQPGKPLIAIPLLTAQIRADLLVIGKSPQKRFLGDLRTRSYEIACRTLCPVASV